MSCYVYRYMHPDYPWLYVGKTNAGLRNRIRSHDFNQDDNIPREYRDLLLESIVYYIELDNSTQSSFVEKFLIDKYKPLLNIKDKHDGESILELQIPKWKKYIRGTDIDETNNLNERELAIFEKENKESEKSFIQIKEESDDINKQIRNMLKIAEQKKFILKKLSRFCEDNIDYKKYRAVHQEEMEEYFRENPDTEIFFYSKYINSLNEECYHTYSKNEYYCGTIGDEHRVKRCDNNICLNMLITAYDVATKWLPSTPLFYYNMALYYYNKYSDAINGLQKYGNGYVIERIKMEDGWYYTSYDSMKYGIRIYDGEIDGFIIEHEKVACRQLYRGKELNDASDLINEIINANLKWFPEIYFDYERNVESYKNKYDEYMKIYEDICGQNKHKED